MHNATERIAAGKLFLPRLTWCMSLVALMFTVSSCAGWRSTYDVPGAPSATRQSGPKSITIALPEDPISLGGALSGSGAAVVPSRYFREFPNAYLTAYNPQDEPVPWLAAQLPSLEDGTWRLLDDGRMEVTWKLRQGVKWHDGADLTSDDVRFSWETQRDPTTQVGTQSIARSVRSVATPDPYTAVFTWDQASYLGALAGVREFDVLPRHRLESPERASLSDHPYFTDPIAFVGSGPYRPIAWERGQSVVLEAFDGYFLGRPRIDRVAFAVIPDYQTALVNVLSGHVDIGYWAVSFEGARTIQQEWAKSGGGVVEMQANNARFLFPQLRPDAASPRDLTDVRVRRALMHAMNRTELAETAASGAAQVINSTTYPDSALGRVVEARSIRYEFDPARAAALFAEMGWLRGGDGTLTKSGQRFELPYRLTNNPGSDQSLIFAVLQEQYRRSGIELVSVLSAPGDQQADALFPGLAFSALPNNQTGFLTRFNGAFVATAENRWAGNNRNGYANPVADELLNRVNLTVRTDGRVQVWAEANRVLVEDLAFLPLYNYPYPYVVKNRVVGVTPGNPINPPSYFVHAWDVR